MVSLRRHAQAVGFEYDTPSFPETARTVMSLPEKVFQVDTISELCLEDKTCWVIYEKSSDRELLQPWVRSGRL